MKKKRWISAEFRGSIGNRGRRQRITTRFLMMVVVEVGDFRQRVALKPGQKVGSRYSIVEKATWIVLHSWQFHLFPPPPSSLPLSPPPLYFCPNKPSRPIRIVFLEYETPPCPEWNSNDEPKKRIETKTVNYINVTVRLARVIFITRGIANKFEIES